jgi:DNA-binding transcriptional MerR regulator
VPGNTFGIGEAARRAGVSRDLIRYYERVGVLPRAPRTAGGFRYYSDETVARLLFVRNAIRFGFTSKELAGFLKARESGRPPCHSVRAAGQRLLKEMDEPGAIARGARSDGRNAGRLGRAARQDAGRRAGASVDDGARGTPCDSEQIRRSAFARETCAESVDVDSCSNGLIRGTD